MSKEIILVDCDQCLLNYNQRVEDIFVEITGRKPAVKNPGAFKAGNLYDFTFRDEAEEKAFADKCAGPDLWTKMPAMPGALEFVNRYKDDFDFIVLTCMKEMYRDVRYQNLLDVGFTIQDVWAAPRVTTENPKKKLAMETNAAFFIDDLVRYFEGVQDISTKLVFVDHQYTDGANDNREGIRIDHTVSGFKEIAEDIVEPYLEDKNRLVSRRRFGR